MSKKELALQSFKNGFNCCQAVLSAYCKDLNIDSEIAFKIADGFGGGMRKGEVCGAITGAIMVLGLKYGSDRLDDKVSKAETYNKVDEFLNAFKDKHTSILCKELLGYNISIPQEYEKIKEENLFLNLCPVYIKDTMTLLDKMLTDNS